MMRAETNDSMLALQEKAKAKPGYYLSDGIRVPGVTTIIGDVLAKPALVPWANSLGLAGIKVKDYVDSLADVGKLAHSMILADLKGQDPAIAAVGYDPATIDLAENCLISYYNWLKGKTIEPILVETPLVSEAFHYGGTPDFYGIVDGTTVLIDFKTGKGIWPEHFYQLAAYGELISRPIDAYMILNIPRAETEQFDEKRRTDLHLEWEIFRRCLEIYNLKKQIEK